MRAPARLRPLLVAVLLSLFGAQAGQAQALAHKGWVGNGFSIETWWKSALFYEVDPLQFQDSHGDGFGDLAGLTSRLDYLQSLSANVLVLSPFRLKTAGSSSGAVRWDAAYGGDEDFDQLAQEASRRQLRLVVDLAFDNSQTAEQMASAARFWLSRGIAGLRLRRGTGGAALSADESATRLRMLHRLCATYAGDRVLLGDAATESSSNAFVPRAVPAGKRAPHAGQTTQDEIQLSLDSRLLALDTWNASGLRAILSSQAETTPEQLAVSDGPDRVRTPARFHAAAFPDAVARQLAAVLLLEREWPMLYFGQELGMASAAPDGGPVPMQWGGPTGFTTGSPWVPMGPNAGTANVALEDQDRASLLAWYRTLGDLRHSQAVLRMGTLTLLDSPDPAIVAWVRRGTGENARATPVLVVLNLADRPTVVSMRDSLHRIGLEASTGVRPLAVSPAGATPAFTASSIALQGYGVYVGALRQAGLEESAAPARHGRHRGR